MAQPSTRRTEQAGIFHFFKEMGSALIMALVAIVYVIQAFKIPTGSMEDSLLVGDFLLGLKFIYGAPVLPFTHMKFPAVTSPKPGHVIIFKYPGADRKDYIKRCVAGPGQTVEVRGQQLLVDGRAVKLPPNGKYLRGGRLDPQIANFAPLRIPSKGDLIRPSELPVREFLFAKNLIHQEHPRSKVRTEFQLYLDGEFSNRQPIRLLDPFSGREFDVAFNELRLDLDDWTQADNLINHVRNSFPDREVDIRKIVYLDDKAVGEYKVKFDNYFMMGDNRDNSMDSRFWGYLNRNFVKAKAFILYFSLDRDIPYWQLPLKIRWNRIGKLIRSWDGLTAVPQQP